MNMEVYIDSLMNRHWEELFRKVEDLFDATHNPDNFHMHIQLIIQFSSNGC